VWLFLQLLYTLVGQASAVIGFVVLLKPAVAMSAQPNVSVVVMSVVETVLFLSVGLWMAKRLQYE